MIVEKKCPFCYGYGYSLERWSNNLYLMKCINPNVSSSRWVEVKNQKLRQVAVERPREKPKMSSYDQQEFNKLQVPFWKLMGQKPKEKDIQYEKQLKRRGMSYGDAVLERDYYQANEKSALPQLYKSK